MTNLKNVNDPTDAIVARRVLVADRSQSFTKSTAKALDETGFITDTADDFASVVERVRTFPADLAVLDIRLDSNDGIDLICALRKIRPNIMCIMITELLEPRSSVRALKAGAFDFLSRPIDIEVLAVLLDRGFERLHLEAQKEAVESALKESETRFRAFFDNTPVAMNLKDADQRFLMINKPYESWLGYSADEIIGKTMTDLAGDNERTQKLAAIERNVFGTGSAQEEEITVARDDGTVHHRIVVKFPVKAEDGSVSAIGTVALENTERKRAEAALRQSEEQTRAVFESALDCIISMDHLGNIIEFNPAAEACFGFTAAEVGGKQLVSLIVPERLRNPHRLGLAQFLDNGVGPVVGKRIETRAIRADGTEFSVELAIEATSGSSGPIFIAFLRDITERQEAESARRESEAQLRAIIDNYPSVITLKDLDGRYLLVNEAFAKSRGVSFQGAIGASHNEIETSEQAAIVNAHDREALERGEPVTYERDWPNAKGERFPRSVIKFPAYDADGVLMGVGTISSDITERKQVEEALRRSEEQFRAVVDNSPVAVILKDLDGHYLMVNKTFREWNNMHADVDYHGKTAYDLFPKALADKVSAHEKLIAQKGVLVIEDREMLFPDGVTRKTWVHKFPIFGSDGECTGVGTVDIDVTGQRDLEEQLAQAQKMEAVGQLTGGVAHDFNNLLGIIIGNLDFLSEQTRDEPVKLAFVERATKAALNGAKLVRQLLAFSRRQPLSPKVVDLNEHVTNMFELLQRSLGESVIIQVKSSLGPWTAEVDPAQLESALLNLAVNARDAMPKGGMLTFETKKVRIDGNSTLEKPDLQPGEYVMLAVTDTGAGMPPEVIAQAFEPFFTTKGVGEGSGLGLSMVYGFTKQSGGDVVIESSPRSGTTVRLYLPHVESDSESNPASDDDQPLANGETVLVVEDDPDLLTLTANLLSSLGYTVLEANDGEAALDLLDGPTGIDLLLTDVVMPGTLSGPALAADAAARHPDMKILYMSGYTADAMKDENSDDGITLLRKPFRRAALAQSIRTVLDP